MKERGESLPIESDAGKGGTVHAVSVPASDIPK